MAGIDINENGQVHDLSCCGCGDSTGWISWRDAHAQGWRKFRTNIDLYAICPACRKPEAAANPQE